MSTVDSDISQPPLSTTDDDDFTDFRPKPKDPSIDIMTLKIWQEDINEELDGKVAPEEELPAPAKEASVAEFTDPLSRAAAEETTTSEDDDIVTPGGSPGEETPIRTKRPFPVREDLNKKFAIWFGDITQLRCDAIVNSTNETMTSRQGTAGKILEAAGPELQRDLPQVDPCKTGECRMTRGYRLPAKYVFVR